MKLFKITITLAFCALNTQFIAAQSITPVKNGSYCQFTAGNVLFEAAASYGGRISSFKIDDAEILFNDENYGEGYLWGSVLWPSPQNEWGWPPSTTLDIDEYSFEVQGNRCRMTSDVSNSMDMRFIKDYYAAIEDTSVTIVYKMVNEGSSTKNNAAWEVTRVPPSGLFFYPTGDASATSGLSEYVEELEGYSWYKYEESNNANQKFFADGSQGWYAHVNADRYIFIKQFVDVPNDQHAPGENEIELWLNGDKAYMELENQSVYAEIPTGETLKYIVKWYLRKLPENIAVEAGNAALVAFVSQTLGEEVSDPDTGTGIPQAIAGFEIQMSPNPAKGAIFINAKASQLLNVKIYSLSGQLLITETILLRGNIDIDALSKGLYVVKIETENLMSTQKLVVE